MNIRITEANLTDPEDGEVVVSMIDAYANDPMGAGKPLDKAVRGQLLEGLRQHPTSVVFLAWADQEAIGVAVCFLGFSTFYARPLLNVHDLAVCAHFRGQGVGHQLLLAAERYAQSANCCKLTLEVRKDNVRAQGLYRKFGFAFEPEKDSSMWALVKELPTPV